MVAARQARSCAKVFASISIPTEITAVLAETPALLAKNARRASVRHLLLFAQTSPNVEIQSFVVPPGRIANASRGLPVLPNAFLARVLA